MIELLKEFEGASLGESRVEGNSIFAAFREEPLVSKDSIRHDYNWHFVFGVRNRSKDPQDVQLFLNCSDVRGLSTKASIFGARGPDSEFNPLPEADAVTDTYKRYRIGLTLGADETRYLSNTYFRSPRLLQDVFDRFARNETCRKEVYGKSVEGRDLIAYVFSERRGFDDAKPVFLVTSGFHPMEADTFATEAVMDHLSSVEGRKLLASFHFVVIPVVNPDGFSHGYNGCNARGINLYWDFREKDVTKAPEAVFLWRYLQNVKPALYIDFHAYTFQLHRKKASPYLKPVFFYRGENVQKLVKAINTALLSYHGGRAEKGPLSYAPSTLGFKLTRRWNTLSYAKYHLHIGEGKNAVQAKAVDILGIIARTFLDYGFTDKRKILSPHGGAIAARIRDSLKRKLKLAWTFRFKYPLLILRSKFKSTP